MAKIAMQLLLLDGTADGLIKCSISGRTEIVFRIPRKDLDRCKERKELQNDGVYFLLGEKKIYVGQAASRKNGKGILNRLKEHDRPHKKFWTEAIVFTTANNSFGATEISWLENRFYNMAKTAKRYDVTNGNDPSPGNVTEAKEIALEDHAAFAQLVLSVIGYKIFEPLATTPASPKIEQPKVEPTPVTETDGEIFVLIQNGERGRKVNAKMKHTTDGRFIVLAGSEISPLEIESSRLSASQKKRRRSEKIDANRILREDMEFNSSSTAAEFVLGRAASGNVVWKKATA